MPILRGSASLTRFQVALSPTLTFDEFEFREISPGAEVRESIGFIPFEPEAEYQIGAARWAFRIRIDKLQPDPTAVRERLASLLRSEQEQTNSERISPRRKKELKHLAEEELLRDARPSSKIIEGVLDDGILLLGTTANSVIGKCMLLLRKIGVTADFKTPWDDLGDGDLESDVLEALGPGQSIWGARFLAELLGDRELMLEPIDGYAKLQGRERRITLAGKILGDVLSYVEDGAELLTAKLTTGEQTFRLDGLAFRISGLSLEPARAMHWTDALDQRLEQIQAVWDLLDRKYAEQRRGRGGKRRVLNPRGAASERSADEMADPDAGPDSNDEDAVPRGNVVSFSSP
jgi:hypothetical protein